MRRYILYLFMLFLLFSPSNALAVENTEVFKQNISSATWRQNTIIEPKQGRIKIYTPEYEIGNGSIYNYVYYGYWDNNDWVVHDGKKELFRALNDNVQIHSTNPQYFSYWKQINGTEMLIMQSIEDNIVQLPENAKYAEAIQNYNNDHSNFTGEIFFQYWLGDGYKNGYGAVINEKNEEVLPFADYYKFLVPSNILGNDFFIMSGYDNYSHLFHKGEKILEAEVIRPINKDKYDLWHISNNNYDYLINIQTGWISEKFDSIEVLGNDIIIAHNGKLFKDLKNSSVFRILDDDLKDITPNDDFNVLTKISMPEIPGVKYKFFSNTNSEQNIKVLTLLDNYEWDKVETLYVPYPEESIQFATSFFYPKYSLYRFAFIFSNRTGILTFFYNNTSQKIINRTAGLDEQNDLLHFIVKSLDSKKNYSRISIMLIYDKDGNPLVEKQTIEDGFTDKIHDYTKVFYKDKNNWYIFDLANKTNYLLDGIIDLQTVNGADVAIYKTTHEQGIFIFENNQMLKLPQNLNIVSLVSSNTQNKTVVCKIIENDQEKIITLKWSL